MSKEGVIKKEGTYISNLSNGKYKVVLDNKFEVTCTISGKMSKNKIFILPGDRVEVEMTGYDLTKGRITRRINSKKNSA